MDKAKSAYIYASVIIQVACLLIAFIPYLFDKQLWFLWTVLGLVLMFACDSGTTKRINKWKGFGGKIND